MSKFRIEIQITLLTIIIGIVVVTIGYFSYKSLSQIVNSIHQGTKPDDKLFLIKDIASDLTALEHTARLYVLTENSNDLEVFYSTEDRIARNYKQLQRLRKKNQNDMVLIDSISKLTQEKLDIWNEILNNHFTAKSFYPEFSEIYSNLEEREPDSASVNTNNNGSSQKELGNEKAKATETFTDRSLEKNKIRIKILKLEREIYKNREQINTLESRLIEKNVIVGKKINQLITETENRETNLLFEKTIEADRLASITYKRLGLFTISAVLLLLFTLFVLFNYLRKTRATQRALTNAREKAEALAHAKEQFAANVSHELRTPVNAIFGLTEQVLQKKMDSNTLEMVSVIFKSAGHLKRIVNDTLDFSKIQANKVVLDSIPFSPAEIFKEVISLIKYEAIKKGVALNFNWEGEKPGILIGDPLRLKQIIINLIGNAIKFTDKGEVALKIQSLKCSDQKVEMEIRVIDTGIGIEEDKFSVVFDEYVQIENATGKKYSGTGLGLSIVKKLVELQGGTIKLESKPDLGTTVTVNICYSEGEALKVEPAINEIPDIPETFKQLSVLVADDEEYNRFLLKNILQKWGIRFYEVKNGREVIDAASTENFGLILMDLNMPEINGIEAATAILKVNPFLNIVAVTAANDELDKEDCFTAGMKGILFKPFSEKDLFDMISSVIEGKQIISQPEKFSQIVDLSELSRLAGGDNNFLVEMVQLFMKSMETGISGIENAIKNENWNSVFENAHKMAAPVKHIGAGNLYKNIKHLEKTSKQPATIASVSPVFDEIKIEIEKLNNILKSYLDGINV